MFRYNNKYKKDEREKSLHVQTSKLFNTIVQLSEEELRTF